MVDVGIGVARRNSWVGPATWPRVLGSEFIKLSTLPSYLLSLMLAYVVMAGFGLLTAVARIVQQNEQHPTASSEPGAVLAGIQGVQLIVVFVAVVFASTEFAQQTVQPTYLAVPRRLPVLASKVLLLGAVSFVIGAAGAGSAILGASLILHEAGLTFSIAPERLGQLVLGLGVYLLVVSVIGVALGTLVRSVIGGLLTALTVLSVLPLILGAAPFEWVRNATAYLPSTAGLLILQPAGSALVMEPWVGIGIAAAWGAGLAIAAAIVIRRTDA